MERTVSRHPDRLDAKISEFLIFVSVLRRASETMMRALGPIAHYDFTTEHQVE